jgi:uncharacterized membrane protein
MRDRNDVIDVMRAVAIVLMVIFHFIFDLTFFDYTNLQIPNGDGWREFRAVIVSLFLITMGASLRMAYPGKIAWRKLSYRSGKLLLAAALVSMVSILITPTEWIYFGILHFIAVASLLCIGLRHLPKTALLLALLILTIYNLELISPKWPFSLISSYLPSTTGDFVAPVPWLASVLLGIWFSHQAWFRLPLMTPVLGFTTSDVELPTIAIQLRSSIRWLSKHSLVIYLLHQPLFFSGFYLVRLLS